MSTTKKVLIAIFSILLIGALAFLITWGVINFNKVKEGMSGTGLYTKDDINKAYSDGYNTALANKNEYDNLINSYKDTIALQTDAIAKLNGEKSTLDKNVQDYLTQVNSLTKQRDTLQTQIDLLNDEITNLNETVNTKDGAIAELIAEKQELIEQHTQAVTRLNAQITTLNNTVEDLNTQIQINLSSVSQLNSKIAELQRTIAFYEEFVGQFETEDQALVTFEFAGSVYEVKTVNKGDKVTVVNPESTEYLIFNGWTLDGEPLDLTMYTVTKNVRIVADVTYKYVVNFTVDGKTKFTQIVEKGNYATEPASPRKNGHTFKFWTLDGETEAHLEQLPIMANTTFVAKFVELHKVDFLYENGEKIINTKSVEHGTVTTAPRISLNDSDVLNGWRVNGNLVDVGNYVVNADTTFVADITHKHKVVFMVDDIEYDVQYIEEGKTVTVTTPSKEGYKFLGWHTEGSDEILDLNDLVICEVQTFVAKFELIQTHNVTFEVTTVQGNRYKTDTVHTAQIEEGAFASAPTSPNYYNYTFKGWSLDGKSVVDVRYCPITEDTTFKAVMQHVNAGKKYTVTYWDYSSAVTTYTVTWGEIIPSPAGMLEDEIKSLPQNYYFKGWSTLPFAQQSGSDTPTILFLNSYVVTENTTLYPVKYYHNGGWIA